MKILLALISLLTLSAGASCQEPDTLTQKDSIVIFSFEDAESPDKLKPKAFVTSGNSSTARGNSWEDRWLSHIEEGGLRIAKTLMARDTTTRVYKTLLRFSIAENGSIVNLKITCAPRDKYIETECEKLVLSAPKKKPVYRNGKFVRTNIEQPLNIKVKP